MTIIPRCFYRVGLLVSLAALLLTGPLFAQSTSGPPTLIKHLRAEINSNDAMRQSNALVDVITLAGCTSTCTVGLHSIENRKLRIENDTEMGAVVDFDALAPDIMEVYRTGSSDGHRLLALSALIKIGNETTLEQLVNEGTSASNRQSTRVSQQTQRSIATYYLEKYPELIERAKRKKTFSLDDVRRAEGVRVKVARKMQTRAQGN